MITSDDVRRLALALPETTEGKHFRNTAFKVRGRSFAGLEGDTHVTLSLGEEEVRAAVADEAGVAEIRRSDRPIGIRVDLAAIAPERLARLVELSWQHAAPKRLVAGDQ
ncbi:MmcQ/YjbR family DNA-binding protein [Nonomuraea terrae]|uniref:MmcQ/YjbR family DNA-binding protein n=1 Tax=Nonomuraea terrae TaxID=2530383 RepID=UPI00379B37A8